MKAKAEKAKLEAEAQVSLNRVCELCLWGKFRWLDDEAP